MLGTSPVTIEISDLPILPADMRAATNFTKLQQIMNKATSRLSAGSGFNLAFHLIQANLLVFLEIQLLAIASAPLYYAPAFFIRRLLAHLEAEKENVKSSSGLVLALGLFCANVFLALGMFLGVTFFFTSFDEITPSLESTLVARIEYNQSSPCYADEYSVVC